jgi:cell division transport system permease protein
MRSGGNSYYNMTSLKRVIKNGWSAFWRNIALSLATIFIMVTVLSLVTFLFFLRPVSSILISDIEKKVDVSVYFKEDVSEDDIVQVESEVSRIPQVSEVEYVSKDDALNAFVDKHKDDPVLIDSLTEVGYNPFLASLNIKAQDASQYEQITKFLETGQFKDLIDNVDYYQRKPVIDKVYAMTSGANRIGLLFSLIFGLIAVLIAFNTIRIAIHNSSEEISIMRLVGASDWFVRGPFLVQGIIVGLISAFISLLIAFLASWALDSKISGLIPDVSILRIFLSNILYIFLIQLAAGIILGVLSSLIAVRKYLKI